MNRIGTWSRLSKKFTIGRLGHFLDVSHGVGLGCTTAACRHHYDQTNKGLSVRVRHMTFVPFLKSFSHDVTHHETVTTHDIASIYSSDVRHAPAKNNMSDRSMSGGMLM